MISVALPWVFAVALGASLVITALHFLSVRQPRVRRLPTTRFVPERDARAVARQAKPSDVLLLLLRVLALLAAGAALAGARCSARGARVSSILVVDRALRADSAVLVSRAVGTAAADGVADAAPLTVLWVHGVSDNPGVAIAAAIREGARQARMNPSLADLSLTVVLPTFVRTRGGWDAWRGQWPATIRLARSGEGVDSSTRAAAPPVFGTVRVVGVGAAVGLDVVHAAFAARGASARGASAREPAADVADVVVYRGNTDGADTAVISVRWPVDGVPSGWRAAPAMDSVGAVAAAGVALVAPWVRTALAPALSDSVRVIAWWSDGLAAAIERTRGTSCVRDVAIAVPIGSDLLLAPAADGLLRALRAPCGGPRVPAPREPAGASGLASRLAVAGAYAPASRFRDTSAATNSTQPSWLAPVLLALAVAALLVEFVVRRHSVGGTES